MKRVLDAPRGAGRIGAAAVSGRISGQGWKRRGSRDRVRWGGVLERTWSSGNRRVEAGTTGVGPLKRTLQRKEDGA